MKIRKGKSRKVEIHTLNVVKFPIIYSSNPDIIIEKFILGGDGKIENLKEIFFWRMVESDFFLKKGIASIIDYDLESTVIYSEKLSDVNENDYYKFINLFLSLSNYISGINNYLDHHTLSNIENYGIDDKGRLKLLDYAFDSKIFTENYMNNVINENTINDISFKITEFIKLISDKKIEPNQIKGFGNFYRNIFPFVLTLKYYKYPKILLFHLYINKYMSLKEIWNYCKEKRSSKKGL